MPVPAQLRIDGCRCVVVGGGDVALRRARLLYDHEGDVTAIAPDFDPGFFDLPVEHHQRPFDPADVEGAMIVIVATDNDAVNALAAQAALNAGALVNRADAAGLANLVFPAHAKVGPITLTLDTGGASANAAVRLKSQLSRMIDPLWPELLEAATPVRALIQERFADDAKVRRRLLTKLSDSQALALLQGRGIEAVQQHWTQLIDKAGQTPTA